MERGPAREIWESEILTLATPSAPASTLRLAVRVEVSARRGTSVGIVAEFVDVEAVLSLGQTAQLAHDGDGGTDVRLSEVNGALHYFAVQHAHSLQRHF